MTDSIVVLSTCSGPEEGGRIARELVGLRLAACVHLIGGMTSVYRWQGKVEEASETLMVIKSTQARFPELRATLQKLHSYDVPEIVALPIGDGSESYLAWLTQQVRPGEQV